MINFEQEWPVVIQGLTDRVNEFGLTPKQKEYRQGRLHHANINKTYMHYHWPDVFICPLCGQPEKLGAYSGEQKDICFHCNFWIEKIETYEANPDKYLIINEEWYTPAPTKPNTPKHCLGYGGRLFKFKRNGSNIVEECTNLWHGGVIPVEAKKHLPDNAVFV